MLASTPQRGKIALIPTLVHVSMPKAATRRMPRMAIHRRRHIADLDAVLSLGSVGGLGMDGSNARRTHKIVADPEALYFRLR